MNRTASSTLMTEGSIWKKIVTFAFPLFLGNLFQQLYSFVDSMVVGKGIGDTALAAVGNTSSALYALRGVDLERLFDLAADRTHRTDS